MSYPNHMESLEEEQIEDRLCRELGLLEWQPPHPCLDSVPELEGDEYEALKADIDANGLVHEFIWIDDDHRIVDGRARFKACMELKKPFLMCFRRYLGDDPYAFCRSMNVHRPDVGVVHEPELKVGVPVHYHVWVPAHDGLGLVMFSARLTGEGIKRERLRGSKRTVRRWWRSRQAAYKAVSKSGHQRHHVRKCDLGDDCPEKAHVLSN